HAQKQFVLDVAQDWYLFLDLLQKDADPNAYASAGDYLDALTAKARDQNMDRHFSFLTTQQALTTFIADGQAIVFGIGIHLDTNNRLFVTGTESVSPAAEAGFVRGDEILAIGPSPDQLVLVSTMSSTQVSDAFGPSQVGITRSFSVKTAGGQTVT